MNALTKSPDLLAKVREHWGEANRHGQLAVEAAWRCGDALIKLKDSLPHGEFMPAVERLGISSRTANRMMQIARSVEFANLANLRTMAAALESIPMRRVTEPATPANHAPQAPVSDTATEAQPDDDPDPSAALEAALDDERAKNEGLAEKLAIVGAQLDPKQLDQIEGLGSQIATLKSQVNSWMSKFADMKRARDLWKRKVKQLEKQLASTGGLTE